MGGRDGSKQWIEKQLKLNHLISITFILGFQETPDHGRTNNEFSMCLCFLVQGFSASALLTFGAR